MGVTDGMAGIHSLLSLDQDDCGNILGYKVAEIWGEINKLCRKGCKKTKGQVTIGNPPLSAQINPQGFLRLLFP